MESRRPQLNRDELLQLKWLLGGGLVLLAVWTVFYLEFDAWTLMALTTAAVLAVLARPTLPARIPRWGHRLAFPAVVAFFLGDLWITGEVLPAIVRLDILLLGYRGITYRKKRDDLQVIVLGLFLIVVAGVLTVSLVFAVQILVFAACALGFLLVITLLESDPANAAPATDDVPAWTHVRWRHLFGRVRAATDWRVVVLAGALFAGVVGVSALLFLAIPRFQLENSLFLERFASKKARSGFNETIRFGEVTEIQQDNGLALSVDVTDRGQIPATPYWRMLVLDEYRDGAFRLSPLQRLRFTRDLAESTIRGTAKPQRGEAVFWTFYVESGVSRYLPLLGDFEQLRFQERQTFRVSRQQVMIALREEPVTMTAYRVEGMASGDTLRDASFALRLAEPRAAAGPAGPAALMLRPGVGEADQAVVQRVVAEIAGGAELPVAEFTRRANRWLGQRHGYSLTPTIPAGPGDPLVRWLVSREPGHCELFAGAFTLMARVAGYPTRVVTGFKGGTWNAYSNNFTVRNSDAHAWCEIFDRGAAAWVRTDPTAGAAGTPPDEVRGEAAIARRLDRSWSARLESLRVFWYRRIVNFDQRTQVETLKAVKEGTQNSARRLREWVTAWMAAAKAWIVAPWDGARVTRGLGTVALFLVLGWVGWTRGRPWWRELRARAGGPLGDPVRREAGRWLVRLGESAAPPEETEPVRFELQRLRFGPRATWAPPEGVFRRARRACRRRPGGRRG